MGLEFTVMGRVFSADGLKPDDDHNPLEATINAHALCGILNNVPKPYRWLYEESGLLHQCTTLEDVYEGIGRWIQDADLSEKLVRKNTWVRSNRERYLGRIISALRLRLGE